MTIQARPTTGNCPMRFDDGYAPVGRVTATALTAAMCTWFRNGDFNRITFNRAPERFLPCSAVRLVNARSS